MPAPKSAIRNGVGGLGAKPSGFATVGGDPGCETGGGCRNGSFGAEPCRTPGFGACVGGGGVAAGLGGRVSNCGSSCQLHVGFVSSGD